MAFCCFFIAISVQAVSKYTENANNKKNVRSEPRQRFRMNKINLIWDKAEKVKHTHYYFNFESSRLDVVCDVACGGALGSLILYTIL